MLFYGHRDLPPEDFKRIKEQVKLEMKYLLSKGITNFICGGAIGFDILCGQLVIKLKRRNSKIKLILALPCKEQDKYWNTKQKADYGKLLKSADEIIFTSEHYNSACMLIRNRYMVDNSGYIIAYCTRRKSGSYYTLNYAESKNLVIITV